MASTSHLIKECRSRLITILEKLFDGHATMGETAHALDSETLSSYKEDKRTLEDGEDQ